MPPDTMVDSQIAAVADSDALYPGPPLADREYHRLARLLAGRGTDGDVERIALLRARHRDVEDVVSSLYPQRVHAGGA